MTRFAETLKKASDVLAAGTVVPEPLVIRDIYGRISFAINATRSECTGITDVEDGLAALEAFAGRPGIFFRDDLFDPDAVLSSPHIVRYAIPDSDRIISLLDRQITGHDWANGNTPDSSIPTLVFYGVKGGVGRSTALALVAYELARQGKKVLLVDLDLESPGLSGLLLPEERAPDFGIVDWLVEDAVGNAAGLCAYMVSDSPIATAGNVRVVPAMGRGDGQYLDKLSRVYADVPIVSSRRTFADRLENMIGLLKEQESPDVVLIDSRAGLHDLAALGIVRLSTTAFLFATNSAQSWQAYRSLFQFWQHRPDVATKVRGKLRFVRALFPETDQLRQSKEFKERAYALFTDTLYDQEPADDDGRDDDRFSYALENSDGPHHAWRINWSSRFQEFDPLLIPGGLFTSDEIHAAYGQLFDGVLEVLGWEALS